MPKFKVGDLIERHYGRGCYVIVLGYVSRFHVYELWECRKPKMNGRFLRDSVRTVDRYFKLVED